MHACGPADPRLQRVELRFPDRTIAVRRDNVSGRSQSVHADALSRLAHDPAHRRVATLTVALGMLLQYFRERPLSTFNTFDIVTAVAIGSAFASTVKTKNTARLDGIRAFVLFFVLQRLVAALAIRRNGGGRRIGSCRDRICDDSEHTRPRP